MQCQLLGFFQVVSSNKLGSAFLLGSWSTHMMDHDGCKKCNLSSQC